MQGGFVITVPQFASLVYITGMMAINFFILYTVLRKEYVNKRAVFFLSSLILYMGVESLAFGYIVFYHGKLLIEPVLLLLASVPLLLSASVKSEVIRVRGNNVTSLLLSLSVVFDEFSMGYLYSSAFGPRAFNPVIDAVSNIAFGIMMVIDGIFFLLISRVKDIFEVSFATFAISMAFLPSIFVQFSKEIELIASLLSTAIMVVNIITLYLIVVRRVSFKGVLVSLSLAAFDLFMMLGLTTFAVLSDMWVTSLSILTSMVWYFILVIRDIPAKKVTYTLKYPFLFLILVNLTELTMGFGESVLGFNITNSLFAMTTSHMHSMMPTSMSGMGSSAPMMHMMRSPLSNPFWWLFPINPLAMGLMFLHATPDPFFNLFMTSFMLVMSATMSPFYVIMMGAEMAFLVYERFKVARTSQVKKWALVILVGIPLFVIAIPYYTNFYVFGMSGMIFPVSLLPFVLSLAAVALASTLFGRRAYCNAVCMSAHMWTNVFYDQFKPKKSSKVWDYLRWFFLVPMVVAFSLYVAMEVHMWSPPRIGMTTLNPLNFYGMFVLNYIWWFFYFLTPVFGAYSCARQGWCGFGTFAGVFNKVLFKVRARDVNTCRSCQAKSCESACPVKIPISTDILQKGYTNRVSCVGCGDCVEACQYDNLTIEDLMSKFRHSVKT
ncbi:4Fe-4S binding protein [Stygiolobus caldivivus]|uniref:4Fe-4S ferredoxin n=1 Tax=Stygiolobus caldivivus TaxID=2824673 RepID=A0A8D5U3Y5_9CREN|nr:4Fe-4S ferredoxin [Stygiolobus caldivivus]BCU68936.1 4Fe-4S ferredoxin [Stygiolobus caldivivus]